MHNTWQFLVLNAQCPIAHTLQHSQQQHAACVQAGMNIGDDFVYELYKHIMPCGFILPWHLLGICQVIKNAEDAFLQILHAMQ